MMEHRSYQAHHYYAALPGIVRETLLDKLKRILRFGNPAPVEGRKRIDPGLPYGHWAK